MRKKIKILSTSLPGKSAKKIFFDAKMTLTSKKFISVLPLINEDVAQAISAAGEHLVFTSRNAVRSYRKNADKFSLETKRKFVYCLSGATKKAVLKLKKVQLAATAHNASTLAEKIAAYKNIREVNFFCGNIRRNDLPENLKSAGIAVKETVVYDTVLTPKKITKKYNAILFFSPSAVRSFFSVNLLKENIPCFCIGETTAKALQEFTQNEIIIADENSASAVANAAVKYFKNNK
jgi:uroporphyrinogen-III synthase